MDHIRAAGIIQITENNHGQRQRVNDGSHRAQRLAVFQDIAEEILNAVSAKIIALSVEEGDRQSHGPDQRVNHDQGQAALQVLAQDGAIKE